MIVLLSILIGVTLGVMKARRKNGSRLDILQYGAVYGIIFAILGLVATVVIERMI